MAKKSSSMWPWLIALGVTVVVVGGVAVAVKSSRKAAQPRALTGGSGTMTGTELAHAASLLATDEERQGAVVQALLDGHYPPSSFQWRQISFVAPDATGKSHEVELAVAPDYLSVGTEDDKLVAVLGLPNANRVAAKFGFVLPTPQVVDRIWKAAPFKYTPAPLPATSGSGMRLPDYWLKARDLILAQGKPAPGSLVAGHKKDVVLTSRLLAEPSKLFIYGWQNPDGSNIQPLSDFHGKDYADYSHGVRPVAPTVRIDGQTRTYRDVLKDPVLFKLLSKDSGPFDIATVMRPEPAGWSMV